MARTARGLITGLVVLVVSAVVLPGLLAGCGGPRTYRVVMKGASFNPSVITIPNGSSVTWFNNDQTAHTTTTQGFKMGGPNPPWMWNSLPMNPGESFTHRFTRPGTYHYFCMVHPFMKGTVIVQ